MKRERGQYWLVASWCRRSGNGPHRETEARLAVSQDGQESRREASELHLVENVESKADQR